MSRAWLFPLLWLCPLAATFAADIDVKSAPSSNSPLAIEHLDSALQATWNQYPIEPTPLVDDVTFLRRVCLDLGGRIPHLHATRAVLDAKEPLDRAALVDRLLASSEFHNHWGRLWTEYLTDARPFEVETHDGRLLQNYLRDALQKNVPYDEFVRTLFRAEGMSDTSGPVNFLLRYGVQPTALTGASAEKFLGVTLKCAECHDHPHATWKQGDFWGVAAYFARLSRMTPADGSGNFSTVLERPRGELEVPDRAAKPNENGEYPLKTIFPRLPGAPTIDTTQSRREVFLNWLTSQDNPYFARHAANRVWEMLLGRPLVASFDPVANATAPEIGRAHV